jgi:hypothetical protein
MDLTKGRWSQDQRPVGFYIVMASVSEVPPLAGLRRFIPRDDTLFNTFVLVSPFFSNHLSFFKLRYKKAFTHSAINYVPEEKTS